MMTKWKYLTQKDDIDDKSITMITKKIILMTKGWQWWERGNNNDKMRRENDDNGDKP